MRSIGGLSRVISRNRPGNEKYPAQPWVRYLDFKDKKIKFSKDMPEGRFKHCAIAVNESTVLVFGGSVNRRNGKGVITYNDYLKRSRGTKESRSGMFLHFPDPSDPENYTTTEVRVL